MTAPKLNLLVLRSADIEGLRDFYEALGLSFRRERHGNGPLHYASENEGLVLELYPLREGERPDQVRLGFEVSDPEVVGLEAKRGDVVIVRDPDGRAVELSRRKCSS